MEADTRRALTTIQRCIHDGRFRVLPHFLMRMDERGVFWPDILGVIDSPTGFRPDGLDRFHRDRWALSGDVEGVGEVELICVVDQNESEETTILITLYWT